MRYFLIDENELARIKRVRDRLYRDMQRMNSDEMRDNAQRLDSVAMAAEQYEIKLEDLLKPLEPR
jgi:hypothetical protein